MKKTLSLAFILSTFLYSQDYYNLELDNTGVSQLIIFQDSITSLEEGDEIGIFDASGIINSEDCSSQTGELLVGSGIWLGSQLEIVSIGNKGPKISSSIVLKFGFVVIMVVGSMK